MLRITLGLLLLSWLLTACGKERISDAEAMGFDASIEATNKPVTEDLQPIKATTISSPTPQVEGCTCALSLQEQADEAATFFLFNWDNGPGVISLNGNDILVQRGASLSPANAAYDSYLHQNEQYNVQTSLNRIGQEGEEGSTYRGNVKITDKNTNEKISLAVVGSCSC